MKSRTVSGWGFQVASAALAGLAAACSSSSGASRVDAGATDVGARPDTGEPPRDAAKEASTTRDATIDAVGSDAAADAGPDACVSECAPGATRCVSGMVSTCAAGDAGCGAWGEGVACGDAQSCQVLDGGASCTCNASACTQAGAVCDTASGVLTTCVAGPDGCLAVTSSMHCATSVANAVATCGDGGCSYTCESAHHDCSGTCADDTSVESCGTSCTPCAPPANSTSTCAAGACGYTCTAPYLDCDGMAQNGCEVDSATDPMNCASCGNACSYANAAALCTNSRCAMGACTTGYLDCDGSPADGCEVDGLTDAKNCGACGATCALGETCAAGACTTVYTAGLIGYWAMDDAPGSGTAADSGPNMLTGTVNGAVVFTPGAGKQGTGAITLSGNGYVDVLFPNNAENQGTGVAIPQGNVTYAMWFQTTSTAIQGLQVVEGDSTWGGGCDRVIGNGGGTTLDYNTWSEVNPAGVKVVNDGAWHHVAYVMDEKNGFLAYVDGVLDVSDATGTTNCGVGCSGFNWASDYWIGSGAGCRFSAGDFTGVIDDVRLYGYPMTAAQVAGLYAATK